MKFKTLFFISLVVGILITGAFWVYDRFSRQQETVPGVPNKTAEISSCAQFPKVQGEISCEEAIHIATAKYGGKAPEIIQGSGFPKKENGVISAKRNFWRIEILLDSPIQKDQKTFNGARSYIDRKTGEELAGGYLKRP